MILPTWEKEGQDVVKVIDSFSKMKNASQLLWDVEFAMFICADDAFPCGTTINSNYL